MRMLLIDFYEYYDKYKTNLAPVQITFQII